MFDNLESSLAANATVSQLHLEQELGLWDPPSGTSIGLTFRDLNLAVAEQIETRQKVRRYESKLRILRITGQGFHTR